MHFSHHQYNYIKRWNLRIKRFIWPKINDLKCPIPTQIQSPMESKPASSPKWTESTTTFSPCIIRAAFLRPTPPPKVTILLFGPPRQAKDQHFPQPTPTKHPIHVPGEIVKIALLKNMTAGPAMRGRAKFSTFIREAVGVDQQVSRRFAKCWSKLCLIKKKDHFVKIRQ